MMMDAPVQLVKLQRWFTHSLVQPETANDRKVAEECGQFLTGSTSLSPKERLDIYIRDYWPRCLESLAEDFPGVKRILGASDFELWMERYLVQCPPRSFTLYHL